MRDRVGSAGDGEALPLRERQGPCPLHLLVSLLALGATGALVACGDDSGGTGGAGGSGTPSSSSTESGSPTTTGTQSTSSASGGGDGGGSGSSSSGDGGAGGQGGSTSSGPVEHCTAADLDDGESLGEGCGIFVNPEHDGNQSGTQSEPYASLDQALIAAQASGQNIYVCITETITLDQTALVDFDVHLYGGWGCQTWTVDGGKTAWTAPAGEIPLHIEGDSVEVTVEGFAIAARGAVDPGGSSIGMMVVGATVTLGESTVTAGPGVAGQTRVRAETAATPDSMNGVNGRAGCLSTTTVVGGEAGLNTCGGEMPFGGSGGNGTLANGGPGSDGSPVDLGGSGGPGQTVGMSCQNGTDGQSGEPGEPGPGADANGALSASGFAPADGLPGAAPGTLAGGGGAGGGARQCGNGNAGPSGGGGGAGGCGGAVGAGGQGGGSSIGLASVGASVTLRNVVLGAAGGGDGGGGAPGQRGQVGGTGGINVGAGACNGAPGGTGGQGGSGGGGRGGHSLAVAFTGIAPTTEGSVELGFGAAGDGGPGGDGDDVGNDGGAGDPGIAQEMLGF